MASISLGKLLMIIIEFIYQVLDEKSKAQTFNISKAIDRNWHAILWHKINGYGVSNWIFGLIQSLRNHTMKIVLNGHDSRSFHINASVPQSSIRGKTLFLICINDLLNILSFQLDIYVDDATIYLCLIW